MEKIIFLDIDGVLNSVRYDRVRRGDEGNIDESRLVLLKELIDKTQAEVVLSSSWRVHWSVEESERDPKGIELDATFKKYGISIRDKTPKLDSFDRAEEIGLWLRQKGDDVESFVIFDDITYGWGELEDYVVKTNSRIGRGLEATHIKRAFEILEGKNEEDN